VRRILIAMTLLVACGPRPPAEEPQEPMPSETLDHQDPGADTSHNKTIHTYGSRWHWPHLFNFGGTPDPFGNVGGAAPHYYTGCGGCASDDRSSLFVVVVLAALLRRRRRAT
jgi:MYXO-CTERM domain-containing protein